MMTVGAPIHPGRTPGGDSGRAEHQPVPAGEGDRRASKAHQPDSPGRALDYGGHGTANRAGPGDDSGILAEPSTDVRPRPSPGDDGHEHHRAACRGITMKHEGETMLRSKCESGRPQGKTSTLRG